MVELASKKDSLPKGDRSKKNKGYYNLYINRGRFIYPEIRELRDNNIFSHERNFSFYLGSALILGVLSLYIIYPFIQIVIGSIFLAYIFYPAVKRLHPYFASKRISLLVIATVISLISLIMFIYTITLSIKAIDAINTYFEQNKELINHYTKRYNNFLIERGVNPKEHFNKIVTDLTTQLQSTLISMVFGLPSFLMTYSLMIVLVYYFMRDGEEIVTTLINLFPDERRIFVKELFTETDKLAKSVIFGHFAVSIFLGAVSFVGYLLIGYGDSFFYAVITTIVGIIPLIGASLVPFLICIYTLLAGNYKVALLMLILSALLSLISQIAYAYVSQKTEATLHPALLIVGMISGSVVLGLSGFFLGPIILGSFFNVLNLIVATLNKENNDKYPAKG